MSNSRPSSGASPHTHHTALQMLRVAGAAGVPYIRLRDRFGGANPEIVLDEVRAHGHIVQRTPSDHGVLAILIDATKGQTR